MAVYTSADIKLQVPDVYEGVLIKAANGDHVLIKSEDASEIRVSLAAVERVPGAYLDTYLDKIVKLRGHFFHGILLVRDDVEVVK